MTASYAVVVPTIGRPSLVTLLESLALAGPDDPFAPADVVVVDDRGNGAAPLPSLPSVGGRRPRVLRSGGRGPAAARNLGWRASTGAWVVFLDDDVLLPPGWTAAVQRDIGACDAGTAATQARIVVPAPPGRPTDAERGTAGLADARWATADMAYRREALLQVGGFDERFPRAYREDADLALRVRRAGWRLVRGERVVVHPVRPAGFWTSVRAQAGNADDALMRRLHGPTWRRDAEVPRGILRRHVALAACVATGLAGAVTGRRGVATAGLVGWAALTGELVARRVLPGPRPGQRGWLAEWWRMLVTSLVLPEAAVAHRVAGEWRAQRSAQHSWPPSLKAVLLDRDGTLVQDVPYNGEPALVQPMPAARAAVERLRAAGLKVGVISNQSGVGRGLLTPDQVRRVNARVDRLLGPFDTWQVCPHAPDAECGCRKPAPGLVLRAARALGVQPCECAVVGDIGADVEAALATGARSVLVPTASTRAEEVAAAPVVATDLAQAVDLLLGEQEHVSRRPAEAVVA